MASEGIKVAERLAPSPPVGGSTVALSDAHKCNALKELVDYDALRGRGAPPPLPRSAARQGFEGIRVHFPSF